MKKRSARTKGREFQLWCKKWLEEKGWVVFNMPIGGRFQKNRDIFGTDLVAKKLNNSTLWIQATRSSSIKKKIEILVMQPWNSFDKVLLMIRRKDGSIDVQIKLNNRFASIGKIIRRRWYAAEGIIFDFGERREAVL